MKVKGVAAAAAVAILPLAAAVGCSAQIHELRPALRNPAAVGNIKATADDNKNTLLDVRAEHLAPPAALDPTLSTYVVWIRPGSAQEFTNVGQLAMRSDRSGRLQATTPFPEFNVLVTAEQSGTARVPSPFVVMEGHAKRP
jgi:hypothetical protein